MKQPINPWVHSRQRRARDLLLVSAITPVALSIGAAGLVASRIAHQSKPLFSQERIGKDGKPFTIRKIRTMPSDTPDTRSAGALDDRASKVGRLLRIAAIDEIPQISNIFRRFIRIWSTGSYTR